MSFEPIIILPIVFVTIMLCLACMLLISAVGCPTCGSVSILLGGGLVVIVSPLLECFCYQRP